MRFSKICLCSCIYLNCSITLRGRFKRLGICSLQLFNSWRTNLKVGPLNIRSVCWTSRYLGLTILNLDKLCLSVRSHYIWTYYKAIYIANLTVPSKSKMRSFEVTSYFISSLRRNDLSNLLLISLSNLIHIYIINLWFYFFSL